MPGEVRVNGHHARFRLRDSRVSDDPACSSVSREPEKRGTGVVEGACRARGASRRSFASQPRGKGRVATLRPTPARPRVDACEENEREKRRCWTWPRGRLVTSGRSRRTSPPAAISSPAREARRSSTPRSPSFASPGSRSASSSANWTCLNRHGTPLEAPGARAEGVEADEAPN